MNMFEGYKASSKIKTLKEDTKQDGLHGIPYVV